MSFALRSATLAVLFVASVPSGSKAQALNASAQLNGSAQLSGSTLPPTAPTNATVPLAARSTFADKPGMPRHRATVSCAGGKLEVHADNSSLNSILRQVAQCTGMKITGGVADQRVFGVYGPAMPATVLATLLDGTGTNVLLRETASDQPADLILTPRTGGATPPSPAMVADDDPAEGAPAAYAAPPPPPPSRGNGMANGMPAPGPGAVSGPVSIPQPINNINGSANNTSPTAANYPVTNSVPLDSLPTPSTTPSTTGIVDAPNPPPTGSDTAALLNGRTTNMPGNTVITDQPTSGTISPGATNTNLGTGAPAASGDGSGSATNGANGTNGTSGATGALTPQQVYEQLQKLRQQSASPPSQTTAPSTPPQ